MPTTLIRREDAAADRLVKYLNRFLGPQHAEAVSRSCLLYKIIIDGSGNMEPPHGSDYLVPKRGKSGFQADIVIRDKKTRVPLVVMEVKYGTFSTHDVITYSAKALRHKEIYPYLRYGFAIVGGKHINEKFFWHNVGFDFAIAFGERPTGRAEVRDVVKRQVGTARALAARSKSGSIRRFENKVEMK